MKAIFVMPSGIEFIKEVGDKPKDFRIAIPRNIQPLMVINFAEETYMLEADSVHLVFEFNSEKQRYEYKYMI